LSVMPETTLFVNNLMNDLCATAELACIFKQSVYTVYDSACPCLLYASKASNA